MDMPIIAETLRTKVGGASGLDATLEFDRGEDGVACIDGRSVPRPVDNVDGDSDCTIAIARDKLAALASGELESSTGFTMGKLEVAGDMSVARELQRVVGA